MQPAIQQIALFQSADGEIRLDVQFDPETVWLTPAQMSELFTRERTVITKHLQAIFNSGELDKNSCVQKMYIIGGKHSSTIVNIDVAAGRPLTYYNLDVIIAVGYRVNSVKGTQFRRWATAILRDYLVQGYALNEKRLRVAKETT